MNILVGHVESIWCRGSFNLGTVCVNLRDLMLEPRIGTNSVSKKTPETKLL